MERERRLRKARRREIAELERRMREEGERALSGAPDDIAKRVLIGWNSLVRRLVSLEKATRELHDGINRIASEADQRWLDGFSERGSQVKENADKLGLPQEVVDILLRTR